MLSRYPDENAALNNVTLYYNLRGEFDKAEKNLLHAIELGDRSTFYIHLLAAYLGQKKFDDAEHFHRLNN